MRLLLGARFLLTPLREGAALRYPPLIPGPMGTAELQGNRRRRWIGGDEFGLLLPHCTTADAETVITRIQTALHAADVAASIGWASVSTEHGFTGALAEADTAMYAVKQQRRLHGFPVLKTCPRVAG